MSDEQTEEEKDTEWVEEDETHAMTIKGVKIRFKIDQ